MGPQEPSGGRHELREPEEFNGDRHRWSHFEFVFVKWFRFMHRAAKDRLFEAGVSPRQLQPVAGGRRHAGRGLRMAVSVACNG